MHHFDGLLGGLIVIRTSTCRALLLKFTWPLSKAHVDAISIKTLHPVSSSFVIMSYFRKNQEDFNRGICIAFVFTLLSRSDETMKEMLNFCHDLRKSRPSSIECNTCRMGFLMFETDSAAILMNLNEFFNSLFNCVLCLSFNLPI